MALLVQQLTSVASVDSTENPDAALARLADFFRAQSGYHSVEESGSSVTARAGSRVGFILWGFVGPGRRMIPLVVSVTGTPQESGGSRLDVQLRSAHRPGLIRPASLDHAYAGQFDHVLHDIRGALTAPGTT